MNFIIKASLFIITLIPSFTTANEWTIGANNLLDLTNVSGTTQYNISDDGKSAAVSLGFDFDFYGVTYTSGTISTNGCFSFSTNYCNDYTPDPLPDTPYTIYPFWTDLIRDGNSKILSKSFDDYFVVGWYDMREFNRASDNTFEMFLYANAAIEFRYGALDIINHDVLIGTQGNSTQYSQYIFHDECNTGTTNSNCINTDWNSSSSNSQIENKSLTFSNQCLLNPLSSTECSGYTAAYLTQQCGINTLYDNSCLGYWEAYDDHQCELDSQYSPTCPGYTATQSVAYFIEDTFDYGYEQETDYGYIEDTFNSDSYSFTNEEPEVFTEMYEEPTFIFEEEFYLDELFESFEEPQTFMVQELETDVYFTAEPIHETIERLILIEELQNEIEEPSETFNTIEELDEWFEEEMEEQQLAEELIEEPGEEIIDELGEELIEEPGEDIFKERKDGTKRQSQLRVVASTIQTAIQSVSGGNSGSSIHATGNTIASGGFSSASANLVNSVASSQQVLTMSNNIGGSNQVSTGISQSASTNVASGTTASTIETSPTNTVTVGSGPSTTDNSQETVVAQNLKRQQESMEEEQNESGQYSDSSELIISMSFVPGFDIYRQAQLPIEPTWYESRDIYANNMLRDNTLGYYGLASENINTLTQIKNLQPTLDRKSYVIP